MMMRSSLGALACLGAASGATMRASRIHAPITYDDTSSVFVDEVDAPTAGEGEVVIRVLGSSVNPVDWKLAEQGVYAAPRPLGADVSGVVAACAACARLRVGDAVWADVGYSGLYPGASGAGAWAEYVAAPEAVVARKPDSLSHAVAGAMPLVALTSFQAMKAAGAPWAGGGNVSVIVTSGDGGTGVLGVQLAKKLGARAVRTCAAPEHVAYVAALLDATTDSVVDFTTASVFDGVPDGSVDVVYDNYGANGTAAVAMRALRPGGWYVFLAGKDGGLCEPPACMPKDGVHQISLWTDASGHDDLEAIAAIADAHGLTVNLDSSFALEDAAQAMSRSMTGEVLGKVAIAIGE